MKKKKLKLYILDYINRHEKLPPHKKEEDSKYAYHCRILKEEGVIENFGGGVWKIISTSKKQQIIRGMALAKGTRSHAYRFSVQVPYISWWLQRKKRFKNMGLKYENIPQGESMLVKRHHVQICDNSINVIFYKGKSFKVVSAREGDLRAILELKLVLKTLERKFKHSLKFGQRYRFNCYSKHHANLNNEFAKYYQERGINQIHIRDENNVLWLIMDDSFNLSEVETVYSKTATRDHDVVIAPIMNKLRKDPFLLQKLEEENQSHKKSIDNLMDLNSKLIDEIRSLTYLQKETRLDINYIKEKLHR